MPVNPFQNVGQAVARQDDRLQHLAGTVRGTAPSVAGQQQANMFGNLAQQTARASVPQAGANPALARVRALQQAQQAGSGQLDQLSQQRFIETTRARQALINAQLQQRKLQLQQAIREMGLENTEVAADLARRGSLVSGVSGLIGTGVTTAAQIYGANQNQPPTLASARQAAPSEAPGAVNPYAGMSMMPVTGPSPMSPAGTYLEPLPSPRAAPQPFGFA